MMLLIIVLAEMTRDAYCYWTAASESYLFSGYEKIVINFN